MPLTPLGLLRQMALSQIVASVAVGPKREPYVTPRGGEHKLRKLRIYFKLNFRRRSGNFLISNFKAQIAGT